MKKFIKTYVHKYGGTSVCEQGFLKILKNIKKLDNDTQIVIVLSAMKNTTNDLISLTKFLEKNQKRNILKNIKKRHVCLCDNLGIENSFISDILSQIDWNIYQEISLQQKINIISYGEYMSSLMLFFYLKKHNIKSKLEDARNHIISKNNFNAIDRNNLQMNGKFECVSDNFPNKITIIQGFICNTKDKFPCLLSRGGSDTTGSMIASKINADKYEIWTDVDGMYTSDPNIIYGSKLIRHINYNLCQELAAMGAKILHPYCIEPCKKKKIPICIRNTLNESNKFTCISDDKCSEILCVTNQTNVSLFEISTLDMWNNHGFVSEIFGIFGKNNIDVNIITTSQFSVSVTTDDCIEKLLDVKKQLNKKFNIKLIKNCNIVSIVGNEIEKNLSNIFSLIENLKKKIYVTHHTSNNLSISFVVKEEYSKNLMEHLHKNIVLKNKKIPKKTFLENKNSETLNIDSWWLDQYKNIYELSKKHDNLYIYDLKIILKKCLLLNKLKNVDKIFYAMKANNNLSVMEKIINCGNGVECVSINEIEFVRFHFGKNIEIMFTPNYCSICEYKQTFKIPNVNIIIDNMEVLGEIFREKNIGLRIDCDLGDGHHYKVITEGKRSKFGISINKIKDIVYIINKYKINIIGLHSHRGSGIMDINSWAKTADKLMKISYLFPNLKWLNLGGGLGIGNSNRKGLNLNELDNSLNNICQIARSKNIEIYLEPGRFVVSESGVLMTKVTQIKKKNNINFLGLSTGMNSLIRPALYNAYHNIVNFTKINGKINTKYDIVGPICESCDIFGKDRVLPKTDINDTIIIENCGAYGRVMSSNYNLREPAREICLF